MQRTFIFIYGILAALAWIMAIYAGTCRPFLPATNEKLFIAFTIAGIVMTLLFLLIAKASSSKPLHHGKQ